MVDITFENINEFGASLGIIAPTSLQFGPDGRLYVSSQFGTIIALTLEVQPDGSVIATDSEALTIGDTGLGLVQSISNHNDDGDLFTGYDANTPNTGSFENPFTNRQVTGIVTSGTPESPVLYISSSDPRIATNGDTRLDTNSGVLTKAWLDDNGEWQVVDLIRGLPRSEENHSVNGMVLDEETNTLYLQVGGNTNNGSPSSFFSFTAEFSLSGTTLEIDLDALEALPVQTDADGGRIAANGANNNSNSLTFIPRDFVYDLPTLDDPNRENAPEFVTEAVATQLGLPDGRIGTALTDEEAVEAGFLENSQGQDLLNPFGGNDGFNQAVLPADAPIRIFADGLRNPFDIVMTENGQLFTIDNGGNGNLGGDPVFVNGEATNVPFDPEPGSPNGDGDPEPLFRIDEGDFLGHPAPTRSNQDGPGFIFNDSGVVVQSTPFTQEQLDVLTEFGVSFNPDPVAGAPAVAVVPDMSQLVPEGVDIQDGFLIDPSRFAAAPGQNLSDLSPDAQAERLLESGTRVARGGPNSEDSQAIVTVGSSTNGGIQFIGDAFGGALNGGLIFTQFNDNLTFFNINEAGDGLDPIVIDGETVNGGADGQISLLNEPSRILDVTIGTPGTEFENFIFVADIDGGVSVYIPNDDGIGGPDLDFDNDGLDDFEDPFGRDVTNGASTVLFGGETISFPFDSNANTNLPGPVGFTLGLTGFATDGVTNFEDFLQSPSNRPDQQIQADNVKEGTAAGGGTLVIEFAGQGTPIGTANNGSFLFQTGIAPAANVETFTVSWSVGNPGLDAGDGSFSAGTNQVLGGFLGSGDQSNFLGLGITHAGGSSSNSGPGFLIVLENDDQEVVSQFISIPDLFVGVTPQSDFFTIDLLVDPDNNTAVPSLTYPGGTVTGDEIDLSGTNLADTLAGNFEIGGQTISPAIGLLTTNGDAPEANSFQAVFDEVSVSSTIDPTVPVPGDVVLAVNAGGPQLVQNIDGQDITFLANTGNSGGSGGFFDGGNSLVEPNGGGNGEQPGFVGTVFGSERSGFQNNAQWTFETDLPNGTYIVDLFFSELFQSTPGQRVFDLSIEGDLVLDDYDILALNGGDINETLREQFTVDVADGTLTIFAESNGDDGVNNPTIGGILIREAVVLVEQPLTVDVQNPVITETEDANSQALVSLLTSESLGQEVVTVNFEVTANGATPGVDYTVDGATLANGVYSGSVQIGPSSSDAQVLIDILNDSDPELAEGLNFTITSVSSNDPERLVEIGQGTADITILDDDTPPPAFTPGAIVLAVNAGGPGLTQTIGGEEITFSANTGDAGGTGNFFVNGTAFADGNSGNGQQPVFDGTIFETERFGGAPDDALPLQFETALPDGQYFVELYFAEIFQPNGTGDGIGARVFDVDIEEQQVIDDLDILSATGGDINQTVVQTFGPITVSDGVLDIDFQASVDNAKISGIVVREAVPAGDDPVADSLAIADAGDITEGGDDPLVNDILPFPLTLSDATFSGTLTVQYTVNGAAQSADVTFTGGQGTLEIGVAQDDEDNGADAREIILTGVSGDFEIDSANNTGTGQVLEDDSAAPAPGTILFRVNAGGNEVAASDGGPAWAQDLGSGFGTAPAGGPAGQSPFLVSGTNTSFGSGTAIDLSLLDGVVDVPESVLQTERFSNDPGNPIQYEFPVEAGTELEITLLFNEGFTSIPDADSSGDPSGDRIFSVNIDGGDIEFADIDQFAEAGAFNTAFALTTTIVSDGIVDIDWIAGAVQNPTLRGIQIAVADAPADDPGDPDVTGPVPSIGTVTQPAVDTDPFTVEVTFDEPVQAPNGLFQNFSGFTLGLPDGSSQEASNVVIANDGLSATLTFNARISGFANGDYGVSIAPGAVTDLAGNLSQGAGLAGFVLDLALDAGEIFDENVNGDLNDLPGDPTDLPALQEGSNIIDLTVQESDSLTGNINPVNPVADRDYFTVVVPEGFQIAAIVLENYLAANDSNLAFIGLSDADIIDQDPDTATVNGVLDEGNNLIGGATIGEINEGNDILAALGSSGVGAGFSGPLGAGTYTFWVNQNAEASRLALDIQLEQIPAVDDAAPVFLAGTPDALSVDENTAGVIADFDATDADEDPITYSVEGTDAAAFTIDENTGELSFAQAPDFENPGDAGADNQYDIEVVATANGLEDRQAVSVTVNDVAEDAPVDPDDLDGDGILNTDDPFFLDGANGLNDVLLAGQEFTLYFNGIETTNPFDPAVGFTGLQVNPNFNPGGVSESDPLGVLTTEGGVSIANGVLSVTSSNQDNFQIGNTSAANTIRDAYNAGADVSNLRSFELVSEVSSADWAATIAGDGFEQFGIQIGTGDVDQFVKLSISDDGNGSNNSAPNARLQLTSNNVVVPQPGGSGNEVNIDIANPFDFSAVDIFRFRLVVDRDGGDNGTLNGIIELLDSDQNLLLTLETGALDLVADSAFQAALDGANPTTGGEGGIAYGIFITNSGVGGSEQFTADFDVLTLRALDDVPATVISIAETAQAAEGGDDVNADDILSFALTASDATFSGDLTVSLTVDGVESSQVVNFTDGVGTLSVGVAQDDLANGDGPVLVELLGIAEESFEIDEVLSSASGAVTEDDFAPVAVADSDSVSVDGSITFNPAANDTDQDNLAAELTVTAISNVSAAADEATVELAGGQVTVTGLNGFLGDVTFDYTVSDPGGNTATGTATVTFTDDVAPAPVLALILPDAVDQAIEVTVDFGEPVNGFDPASVTLSNSAGLSLTNGTTSFQDGDSTATVSFAAPVGGFAQNTDYSAAITADAVTDASGNGNSAASSTPAPFDVDDAPAFLAGPQSIQLSENIGGVIASYAAEDLDGDAVTYSLDQAGLDAGFAIDPVSGALSVVAPDGFDFEALSSGNTLSFNVIATSTTGGNAAQTALRPVTVTVNDVNEAPDASRDDVIDADDDDVVILSNDGEDNGGNDTVTGTSQELDEIVIENFEESDSITVEDAAEVSIVDIRDGSVILGLDIDGDDLEDLAIELAGSQLQGDELPAVEDFQINGNTITFAPQADEVPILPDPITVQAEDFDIVSEFFTQGAGAADGGEVLRLGANETGVATLDLEANNIVAGQYNILATFFDENDGESSVTLSVTADGQTTDIGSFVFNQPGPGNAAQAANLRTVVLPNIAVPAGATLTLTATSEGGEFARIDSLTFQALPSELPNQAPDFLGAIGDVMLTEDETFSLDLLNGDARFVDPDEDDLSFEVTTSSDRFGNPLFSIDQETGILTATPDNADALDFVDEGAFEVTVTATDEGGEQTSTTFTVSNIVNVNDAPTIGALAAVSAQTGEAIDDIDIGALVDDIDGDDLTVTVDGLPGGLVFDPETGLISGTPLTGGSSVVTVTVDDGQGEANSVASTSFVINTVGGIIEGDPVRIQAEDFALDQNFFVESQGAADEDQVIRLDAEEVGVATLTIPVGTGQGEVPAGTNNVRFGFFDENDGVSTLVAEIVRGDTVVASGTIDFDQTGGGNAAQPQNLRDEAVIFGADIQEGDVLRVTVTARGDGQDNEFGRIDYVEFVPQSGAPGNLAAQIIDNGPLTVTAGGTLVLNETIFSDPEEDVLSFAVTDLNGQPIPGITINANGELDVAVDAPAGDVPILLTAVDQQGSNVPISFSTTLTIEEGNFTLVSIAPAASAVEQGDSGATDVAFAISTNPAAADQTIEIAFTVGGGAEQTAQVVLNGSGQGVLNVPVAGFNDAEDNGDETADVVLTGITTQGFAVDGAAGAGVATVVEDDADGGGVLPDEIVLRINAGGVFVEAIDDGPDWLQDLPAINNAPAGDPNAGSGSADTSSAFLLPITASSQNRGDFGDFAPADPGFAGIVPDAVLDSARSANVPFTYEIPVADLNAVNGDTFEVRIYLAETAPQVNRNFDISLEGTVSGTFDDVTPNQVSGSFVLTEQVTVTDGALTLSFLQDQVNNPIVNGIEIVRLGSEVPGDDPGADTLVSLASSASAVEDGDSGVTTVSFDITTAPTAAGQSILVEFAVNGVAQSQQVALDANGQGTLQVAVDGFNDAVNDGDDVAAVALTGIATAGFGVNASASVGQATIIEDDAADPGGAEAQVLLRINPGGQQVADPNGGLPWLQDQPFAGGNGSGDLGTSSPFLQPITPNGQNRGDAFGLQPGAGAVPAGIPEAVLDTNRSSNGPFTYEIPIDTALGGETDLTVRLYFAELFAGNAGDDNRVFDVLVEGQAPTVFDDIDLADDGNAFNVEVREFDVTVNDVSLTLTFSQIPDLNGINFDNPIINGIEILSQGSSAGGSNTLVSLGATASAVEDGDSGTTSVGFDITTAPAAANQSVEVSFVVGSGAPQTQTVQLDANGQGTLSVDIDGFNDAEDNGDDMATVVLTGVNTNGFALNASAAAGTATITEDDGASDDPAPVEEQVLIRINAFGGLVEAADDGPDWLADTTANPSPFFTGTQNRGDMEGANTDIIAPNLADVPNEIFLTQRSDDGNFSYDFDLADIGGENGTFIVNLYFGEVFDGNNTPGSRQFDVELEGQAASGVLDDLDVSDFFNTGGGVISTVVQVTDGELNVNFNNNGDISNNAILSGIEVIQVSGDGVVLPPPPPPPPANQDDVLEILGLDDGVFDGTIQGEQVDSTDNSNGSQGAAVLTIIDGANIDASNFGNGSFQITNTGDKEIAAVFIDIRSAVFGDQVFDIDGTAGDTASDEFEVTSDGNTGAFFEGANGVPGNNEDNLFFPGDTPLADTSGLGDDISGGFRGLLVRFDGSDGGFEPGETVGFAGDGDPNSVAGFTQGEIANGASVTGNIDSGGQSGAELIGSSFTVVFNDGSTATGFVGSDTSGGGGVGEAVEGREQRTANLTVNTGSGTFSSGENGTYGGFLPQITVTGSPGDVVRVVLQKGFNSVSNGAGSPDSIAEVVQNRLEDSQSAFPANNAFDLQFVDVTIGPDGTAVVPTDPSDPDALDFVNTTQGISFNGDDVQPIALTAAVIVPVSDGGTISGGGDNDFVPLGPVSQPIYLQNQGGPVNPNNPAEPGQTVLSLSAAVASVEEDGDTGTTELAFTLNAVGDLSGDVAVTYSVNNDGVVSQVTETFNFDGPNPPQITVEVANDDEANGTETVSVTLISTDEADVVVSGATATASVTEDDLSMEPGDDEGFFEGIGSGSDFRFRFQIEDVNGGGVAENRTGNNDAFTFVASGADNDIFNGESGDGFFVFTGDNQGAVDQVEDLGFTTNRSIQNAPNTRGGDNLLTFRFFVPEDQVGQEFEYLIRAARPDANFGGPGPDNSEPVFDENGNVIQDGNFLFDQQNDVRINIISETDPSITLEDLLAENDQEELGDFVQGFARIAGNPATNGNFGQLSQNIVENSGGTDTIIFEEAGFYTFVLQGRSIGLAIDSIDLFRAGPNPGGQASSSPFVTGDPTDPGDPGDGGDDPADGTITARFIDGDANANGSVNGSVVDADLFDGSNVITLDDLDEGLFTIDVALEGVADPGSFLIQLDGPGGLEFTQVENLAAFELTRPSDALVAGDYTVDITVFDEDGNAGAVIASDSVTFTVIEGDNDDDDGGTDDPAAVSLTLSAATSDDIEINSTAGVTSPDIELNLGAVIRFTVPNGADPITQVTSAILSGINEDNGGATPTISVSAKDTLEDAGLLEGLGDTVGDADVTVSGPAAAGTRFTIGDVAAVLNDLIASQGPIMPGDVISLVLDPSSPRRDVDQGTFELQINGESDPVAVSATNFAAQTTVFQGIVEDVQSTEWKSQDPQMFDMAATNPTSGSGILDVADIGAANAFSGTVTDVPLTPMETAGLGPIDASVLNGVWGLLGLQDFELTQFNSFNPEFLTAFDGFEGRQPLGGSTSAGGETLISHLAKMVLSGFSGSGGVAVTDHPDGGLLEKWLESDQIDFGGALPKIAPAGAKKSLPSVKDLFNSEVNDRPASDGFEAAEGQHTPIEVAPWDEWDHLA